AVNRVSGPPGTYSTVTLGSTGPLADATAASFNGTSSSLRLPAAALPGSGARSTQLWLNTTTPGGVLLAGQAAPIGSAMCPCLPALWVGSDGRLRGLTPSDTATGPFTATELAGKCIDDFQDSTANGNPIVVWTCNASDSQSW